jgi:hypothetical protein
MATRLIDGWQFTEAELLTMVRESLRARGYGTFEELRLTIDYRDGGSEFHGLPSSTPYCSGLRAVSAGATIEEELRPLSERLTAQPVELRDWRPRPGLKDAPAPDLPPRDDIQVRMTGEPSRDEGERT